MSLAIHELERAGHPRPATIALFLHEHTFPIVEGRTVTFVYVGAADEVHLRHWIYGLPSSQAFVRMHGSSLWFLVMELPEGSRVEYKLEVVRAGRHQLVQDPLNPHAARDPYGANSVVYGAGYTVPGWTLPDPDARPGENAV